MRLRKKQKKFIEDAGKGSATFGQLFWRRFRRNRLSVASVVVIALFALVAVLGYLITPDHTPHCNQQYLELTSLRPMSKATFIYIKNDTPPQHKGLLHKMLYGQPLDCTAMPVYACTTTGDSIRYETYTGSKPNNGDIHTIAKTEVKDVKTRTFVFGTDSYGRDVLSQVMIGCRISLSVGLIAVAIALIVGIFLGATAAYYGGWVDNVIMWIINVVWSIPTVLLVIAITFALGRGFWQVFVAVGLTMWVDVARVVRGQVYSIKEKEYIEAARAIGATTPRIIMRHILPNIAGPVTVITASNFATAILLEAGLSFLGIGVQPPMTSWGGMVKENYGQILLDSAYQAFVPGVAIMIIVLAFMLLGNGVRDALDVKQQ